MTISQLPPHLSNIRNRGSIKRIITILRNPDNWSGENKTDNSRQWKVKKIYEHLENELGIEKIVDHLMESSFWNMIPELQDPKIVEAWLSKTKEPFLCIEPFLIDIAKKEGIENSIGSSVLK